MHRFLLALMTAGNFMASAAPEYDIVLLAPEGQELSTSAGFDGDRVKINDSGYAIGSIRMNDDEKGFVYHPDFGFKIIDLLYGAPTDVNEMGMVVGRFNTSSCIWGCDDRVFIYNSQTDEIIDLMALPEMENRNQCAQAIGITNNNQIAVRNVNNDLGAFIYDLNEKRFNFELKDTLQAINSQGQMIGGDYSWVTHQDMPGWFYDPSTGYTSLGSLDRFNRWPVMPEVLSENGFVAGTGRDTQDDLKLFVWHQEEGLREFDMFESNWVRIWDINNEGWTVGYYEQNDRTEARHAFLIKPDLQSAIDLGSLGGKESQALAINDLNQVVGESELTSRSDKTHAFIWDTTHGMRDLSKLIPTNTGWKELILATSINNEGYIVGTGIYYGVEHQFLLIPKK